MYYSIRLAHSFFHKNITINHKNMSLGFGYNKTLFMYSISQFHIHTLSIRRYNWAITQINITHLYHLQTSTVFAFLFLKSKRNGLFRIKVSFLKTDVSDFLSLFIQTEALAMLRIILKIAFFRSRFCILC